MRRKLLVLDFALAGLLFYAGWQLRSDWLAARAREAATLHQRVRIAPPPLFTPLPAAPPVAASGYADIAEKMLFDKSRNPTVVVELPPAPPPPPPKPMPPLPIYHGMMNLGDGPLAVFSVAANTPNQAVRPGEEIGQFKLVDVNSEEVVFEWDGKTIQKTPDELMDRGPVQQAAAAAPARTEAAPPPAQAAATPTGPGQDTGRGFKTCNPNDSTPAGAVVDGYRKVISATPFGNQCRWDPVGQ